MGEFSVQGFGHTLWEYAAPGRGTIEGSGRLYQVLKSHTTYFNPRSFFVNTNIIIYSTYSGCIIYSCSSNLSTYLSRYDVFCNLWINFDGAHGGCAILLIATVGGNKQKTCSHQALGENVFSVCFPLIQGIFCLFFQNTKNQTVFHFCVKMDRIILLCFLFVCVGNSLTVFQANTNFTCILTLFSWNTETIPSSGSTHQQEGIYFLMLLGTKLLPQHIMRSHSSYIANGRQRWELCCRRGSIVGFSVITICWIICSMCSLPKHRFWRWAGPHHGVFQSLFTCWKKESGSFPLKRAVGLWTGSWLKRCLRRIDTSMAQAGGRCCGRCHCGSDGPEPAIYIISFESDSKF